ncbi:acyltransferase-domain-containing protein [Geranomyces variabilis]|nr:acyltransferase-domain-containing protein [Geranomyces variabilis]
MPPRPPLQTLKLASPKRAVIGPAAFFAKVFLNVYCKRTRTLNEQRLFRTVLDRTDRPLITVANHSSVLDDPGMGVLPWSILLHKRRMRWSLGAKEICFGTPFTSWFFGSGQVIPTVRGDGVFQPAIDVALAKLAHNGWIHIFPEGKVNQLREQLPYRWGVGRLILESPQPPLVLPIWHRGFEAAMPEDAPDGRYYPRPGKELVVAVGEVMDFATNGVLEKAHALGDEAKARAFVTAFVREKAIEAQRQAEKKIGEPDWWTTTGAAKGVDDDPPRKGDPS